MFGNWIYLFEEKIGNVESVCINLLIALPYLKISSLLYTKYLPLLKYVDKEIGYKKGTMGTVGSLVWKKRSLILNV